jgi:hypothetical protein
MSILFGTLYVLLFAGSYIAVVFLLLKFLFRKPKDNLGDAEKKFYRWIKPE